MVVVAVVTGEVCVGGGGGGGGGGSLGHLLRIGTLTGGDSVVIIVMQ